MFISPQSANPTPQTDHTSLTTTCWSAPGTCGEFVQGRLDGADFLINNPIDRFSRATIRHRYRPGIAVADSQYSKVAAVLEKLSARLAIPAGFEVQVESDLPQGKGMASSTADCVAAIGATLAVAGKTWSAERIARLLTEVEPSDCVHIPGVGHVGHLSGRVFGTYPAPTGLRALVVDCGGVLDTVGFDRTWAHQIYARHETLLRSTMALAIRSLVTRCNIGLAKAATMSARLSQKILPKAQLPDALKIGREHGALGITCAHSGSVFGILYEPSNPFSNKMDNDLGMRLRSAIERAFGGDVSIIGDHKFISGGVYVQSRN